MALTTCHECRRAVSESATTCPSCGYPTGQRARLVYCPHCDVDVVPYRTSANQVTKQCPRCERSIVGVNKLRLVLGAFLVLALGPAALGVLVVGLLLYRAWAG